MLSRLKNDEFSSDSQPVKLKLDRHKLFVSLIMFVLAASCVLVPAAKAADEVKSRSSSKQISGKKPSARKGAVKPSEFESKKLDSKMFEDASSRKSSGSGSGSAGTGALVRLLFGLAFVVGLIYLVNWLLKRSGRSSKSGGLLGGNRGLIEVVATTPLAQNRALHVVRVGDEVMVVGATDQSINRLGSLDSSLISEDSGFGSVLKERLGIRFVDGAEDAPTVQRVENENGLQRLIRSMQARTARQ